MKIRLSLVGKLRLKKALKYTGLLLVLAFFAGAIATNFFGDQARTAAADKVFDQTNKYMLDGWEMSNDNALGRMMPVKDYNGKSLEVRKYELRMDNSASGFHDSPLFSQLVDKNDPTAATMLDSGDGTTKLSELTITDNGAVTTTPLDFFRNNARSVDMFNEHSSSYGVIFTGYFYSNSNISSLKFAAAANDGCKIQIWNNSWVTAYDEYDEHSDNDLHTGPVETFTYDYAAQTYLPVRIIYFNKQYEAGMYIFANGNGSENWNRISGLDASTFGKFYTMPTVDSDTGLVADYYVGSLSSTVNAGIASNEYYANDKHNTYRYGRGETSKTRFNTTLKAWDIGKLYMFDDNLSTNPTDTPRRFQVRNFRFSYISKDVAVTVKTSCEYETLAADKSYKPIPDGILGNTKLDGPRIYSDYCANVSTPFLNAFGRPRPEQKELWNAPASPTADIVKPEDWKGGRSKLKLKISGSLYITPGSAIDVSGAGWSGAIVLHEISNIHNGDRRVMWKGFGYGGGSAGVLNDDNDHIVAGGGSHGAGSLYPTAGRGAHQQVRDSGYRSPTSPHYIFGSLYDNVLDPLYPGSGGGSSGFQAAAGSGGGYINIVVDGNIQMSGKIRADGDDSIQEGGGGSGGAINITASNSKVIAGTYRITAIGGSRESNQCEGNGGGGTVYLKGKFQEANVLVNSGESPSLTCNWGTTDGAVIIDSDARAGLSIKKSLEPVSRNRVAYVASKPETYFNPYALVPGDVINVKLEVEDLTVDSKITDEVLKQGAATTNYWYCDPTGTLLAVPVPSTSTLTASSLDESDLNPPKVSWQVSSTNTSKGIFSYQCMIKKR